MTVELYKELKQFGAVKTNAPLAKFTTFKIGGPADLLVTVAETKKLIELLNYLSAQGVPYLILGGGSNLLLPDEQYEGVVVKVECRKTTVDGTTITAEAGESFGALTMLAVKHSLTGLEWAAGLPGTVGGAVRGNAGAMESDTGRSLKSVTAWVDGEVRAFLPNECSFGYRDSIFKHNGGVVLSATFALQPGDAKTSLLRMQEIVKKRNGHYPPFPSAGSFFKNVPLASWQGDVAKLPPAFMEKKQLPAGWLIDQAGLKGKKVGGAQISNEHGNFLINAGGATQRDIRALVEEVQGLVYNKFNVHLEEEVQIIS